jgi:hypothetical protein
LGGSRLLPVAIFKLGSVCYQLAIFPCTILQVWP